MTEPIVWEVVPENEPEEGEDVISSEELTQALVRAHILLDAHDRGEAVMRTTEVDDEGNRSTFEETGPETRARQIRAGVETLRYSASADALYIRLKQAPITQSHEIAQGIIVDFDDTGSAVGVVLLNASERVKHETNGGSGAVSTQQYALRA